MNTNSELTIKLSDFEGPLDLLLHLIQKSEMDIYDIPIVEITNQFTYFISAHNDVSLDAIGEYFVMAARLTKIKSKFLLPSDKTEILDENDSDSIDPRIELTNQLLIYKQFQEAASSLSEIETGYPSNFSKNPSKVPDGIELTLVSPGITTKDLQMAFMQMLNKRAQDQVNQQEQEITSEKYTISDKIKSIRSQMTLLQPNSKIPFQNLFSKKASVDELVTTFLALLELTKYQEVFLSQNDGLLEVSAKRKNESE